MKKNIYRTLTAVLCMVLLRIAEELKKYKSLLDSGIITQAELTIEGHKKQHQEGQ